MQGERGREVGKFSEVWHRDLSLVLLEQGHIFALGLSFFRNIPNLSGHKALDVLMPLLISTPLPFPIHLPRVRTQL